MMNAAGSYFPNAIVGLVPQRTDGFAQAENEVSGFPIELPDVGRKMINAVHDFSVDVELQLIFGRITNTNGFGIFVAREPAEHFLFQGRLAVNRVKDLKLRPSEPRGVKHPTDECFHFIVKAKRDKGPDGE